MSTHSHLNPPTVCEPFTSTTSDSKAKTGATSKTPSTTQKPRATTKRTFQELFAEGSAKDNQMLERLGTQKHEWVLVELELKRRKLEHKTMEKQHQCERERDQREHEHEQHEVHMLEMRLRISQDSS